VAIYQYDLVIGYPPLVNNYPKIPVVANPPLEFYTSYCYMFLYFAPGVVSVTSFQ